MSDPFVAEIRIFPFDFAPKGWAFCNGQLQPISQNTALFSLLGTYYGGDGKSTFALPNLQGNVPIHQGQGPGLSSYDLGQSGGSDAVALLQTEMPLHSHGLAATSEAADLQGPAPTRILGRSANATAYMQGAPSLASMATQSLSPSGGDQPHNNMQPYLTLNFCIALQGIFPPRS